MPDSKFNKVISVDNLRKAWIKVSQYAKTNEVFFDEYAYNVFSEHLDARLQDLSKELRDGTYRPSFLRYTRIPKGTGERKIYFLGPKDSVVVQAIINIIGPLFEANFAKESFGNRLNINLHESKDTYENWQEKYSEYISAVRGFTKFGISAWYLITDIEDYYPSISKEWLMGLFRAKVDNQTFDLIRHFINLDALGDGEEREFVPGIPPGPVHSHFFANIYLDDFDHLANKLTLGYARYVDDICLVCKNQVELETAKDKLSKYLSRWNQKFKETDKTIKRPILDVEPLFEHTRNMKYATRLDFVEAHEESAEAVSTVGATEKPFFRLYKIAEREGDLNRLVEEAGFIIALLRHSSTSDLDDVIYSLLETHPVRPSTLKAALIYLLEIENDNPSEKFKSFFLGDQPKSAYISTLFLRLLPSFKWHTDLAKEIVYLYRRDPHYLVRANAYIAMKELGITFDGKSFADFLAEEPSIYAKERLIDCFTNLEGNDDEVNIIDYLDHSTLSVSTLRCYIQLITQGKLTSDFINTIWAAVKEKKLPFEFYIYLYFISSVQDFLWLAEELIKQDTDNRLLNVIRPLSLEVINELTQDSEIIRLHRFAAHVRELGFLQEALVGYFQATSSSPEISLSEEITSAVKIAEKGTGLPEWINDTSCTRYIYRQEGNDTDYLCQYIDDNKQNKGILEIISVERIKSGGFSSVDEWADHLISLRRAQIIPSIYLGNYGDSKFSCFYEFPQGYLSLSKILSSPTTKDSLSAPNIFNLGLDLLEKIDESSTSSFLIHSVDPLNILWSPLDGKLLLVGVGASLGAGIYYCGIDGCKTPKGESELGISATMLHFGLLIYQLLVNHCAIEDLLNTRSKYSSLKVSDLMANLEILPHFKMILGRLLNPDPGKRYGNIADLTNDYRQANVFRNELLNLSISDSVDEQRAILKDFISFRLRVISRNPGINVKSPILHATWMIDELANVIQYLSPELTDLWIVGLDNKSKLIEFPSEPYARTLSPEGKRLLDIAYGWEKLHELPRLPSRYLTSLSRLLLYRTLAIENLATFVGILFTLPEEQLLDLRQQMADLAETIDLLIMPNEGDKQIIFCIAPYEYPIRMSKQDLFDLQLMANWGKDSTRLTEAVSSLQILGLFFVLNLFGVEVFADGNQVFQTTPILKNKIDDISKFIWVLIRSFPTLDDQIINYYSICNGDSPDHLSMIENDIWLRYVDFQRYIRLSNPAKRKPGQVYSYQVRNYRYDANGLVDVIAFKKTTVPFDTKETFISGNPKLVDQDILRPVLVDVSRASNQSHKVSSVLAPIGRFTELPFKERTIPFFEVSKFIHKHKYFYRFVKSILTLLFLITGWFLADVLSSSISGSPQPLVSGAGSVLSGIFGYLSTERIKKLVDVAKPEDNDKIYREKRLAS